MPPADRPIALRTASRRAASRRDRPRPLTRATYGLLANAALGAAMLAGSLGAPRAHAAPNTSASDSERAGESGNEVAFATPRTPGNGHWDGVGLPQPLTPSTVARIRHIFILQEQGEMDAAASETAALDDRTLLGEILADRYLRQTAAPSASGPVSTLTRALGAWLRAYPDLPDARAIHAALLARLPHGASAPAIPNIAFLDADKAGGTGGNPEEADPQELSYVRNPSLDRAVRDRSGSGLKGADAALRLIAHTRGLSPAYAGQLRAEVALDLFTQGFDQRAAAVGADAWRLSDDQAGLGPFVAGLALWRSGDVAAALPRFEAAARAKSISASLRAGAALWAARAHLRSGDTPGYTPWLENAAALPHTFYGLLATRMLGRPIAGSNDAAASDVSADSDAQLAADSPDPDAASPKLKSVVPRLVEAMVHPGQHVGLLSMFLGGPADHLAMPAAAGEPVLTEIDVEAVGMTPAGRRAFALLQVGQDARAEASLRQLWAGVGRNPALRRAIMLVARAADLTGLAAQTATLIEAQDGQRVDAERFPVPRLRPAHGFTTDPALVYALTRLESNFDPSAVSGAGAHGLMQLMPVTAGYVTGHPDRFTDSPSRLHDAPLNLDLGQRYVSYLAHAETVDDSLIKLLASYNAGPNALRNWSNTATGETDPLLFIESIPVDETRQFVRRGLSYLWIYAARMNLPCPSLDTLARGAWPHYGDEDSLSQQPVRVATIH